MGVGSLLSGLSAEALEDPAQKPTEEFRSQRSDGKTKLLSAESVKYRPHSRENKV